MNKNLRAMNKNPIDKLFRNKLEGVKISPSSQAWEKLQSGIEAQKGISTWRYMGIAAGIVLLTLIGYIIYNQINNDLPGKDNTVAGLREKSKSPDQEPTPTKDQITITDEAGKVLNENNSRTISRGFGSRSKTDIANISKLKLDLYKETITEKVNIELKQVDVPLIDLDLQWAMLAKDIDEEKQPVTITYTIGEFHPSTMASAALPQEENNKSAKSKLKKAWKFAKDVKNGEEKLPNLRELKNDLLAFNKKKVKNSR